MQKAANNILSLIRAAPQEVAANWLYDARLSFIIQHAEWLSLLSY